MKIVLDETPGVIDQWFRAKYEDLVRQRRDATFLRREIQRSIDLAIAMTLRDWIRHRRYHKYPPVAELLDLAFRYEAHAHIAYGPRL